MLALVLVHSLTLILVLALVLVLTILDDHLGLVMTVVGVVAKPLVRAKGYVLVDGQTRWKEGTARLRLAIALFLVRQGLELALAGVRRGD